MFRLFDRLAARRAVRVKREHLLLLWALRACVEPATTVEVARLVATNPTRIRVHLDWMLEQRHVCQHPAKLRERLPRYTLTPAGETFIANLIEDLLATANAWGGARQTGVTR